MLHANKQKSSWANQEDFMYLSIMSRRYYSNFFFDGITMKSLR
jgi:hypothetical protein